jgi:hypothetical protein
LEQQEGGLHTRSSEVLSATAANDILSSMGFLFRQVAQSVEAFSDLPVVLQSEPLHWTTTPKGETCPYE